MMALRIHLFPYRTQKLSLSSLMLLRLDRGKVGRCQVFKTDETKLVRPIRKKLTRTHI